MSPLIFRIHDKKRKTPSPTKLYYIKIFDRLGKENLSRNGLDKWLIKETPRVFVEWRFIMSASENIHVS